MLVKYLFGYPDFIGRRFAWAGYGNGPSSYVTGGDPLYLPTYNGYIDAVFGTVFTVSGNYTVTPIPLGYGARQKWNLIWYTVANTSETNSVTAKLGSAANYALLGASGITNSGSTVVSDGNIGSSPTPSITGFPPGVLTPPSVVDNTDASAAQTALAAAIVYYQGLTPTLSGLADLSTGGNGSTASTYTPGNYFGGALLMPTGIILDAQGNPNAQFVFVASSTINLASGQTVALINGAQAANVVFVAGSSFTSVAPSAMNGNILAAVSATIGGGTQNGRVLANTGAVSIATAATIVGGAPAFVAGGQVAAGTNLSGETVQIGGYGGTF